MEESTAGIKKPSLLSTKKELLDAYQSAVKQLEEKSKAELRPQAIVEAKKRTETIQKADELSLDAVAGASSSLKTETNKLLAALVERLETEIRKYGTLQEAVEAKKTELAEVYEIEKSAFTLAALIESQRQKRQEFEDLVSREKERLMAEIQETRAEWDEEVKTREAALKEKALAEQKARDREREEYIYQFKRDQKLEKDKYEDLRSKIEKELAAKKETVEKELSQREALIAEKEAELAALREKVARIPQDLDASAAKAWKEAGENHRVQLKNRGRTKRPQYPDRPFRKIDSRTERENQGTFRKAGFGLSESPGRRAENDRRSFPVQVLCGSPAHLQRENPEIRSG
jgi:hypothetical protein